MRHNGVNPVSKYGCWGSYLLHRKTPVNGEKLRPFSTEPSALAWLEAHQSSAALLDINLGHGASFQIAALLKARKIPFIFITGYESAMIPAHFAGHMRLQKPN